MCCTCVMLCGIFRHGAAVVLRRLLSAGYCFCLCTAGGEREVDEDEENYFDREDADDDDDDDAGGVGSGAGGQHHCGCCHTLATTQCCCCSCCCCCRVPPLMHAQTSLQPAADLCHLLLRRPWPLAGDALAAAPGVSGRNEAAAAMHQPPPLGGGAAAAGGVSASGRVVLASTSPLPGGMGSLVDYGDDDDDGDDDTLPLRGAWRVGGAGGVSLGGMEVMKLCIALRELHSHTASRPAALLPQAKAPARPSAARWGRGRGRRRSRSAFARRGRWAVEERRAPLAPQLQALLPSRGLRRARVPAVAAAARPCDRNPCYLLPLASLPLPVPLNCNWPTLDTLASTPRTPLTHHTMPAQLLSAARHPIKHALEI